MKEGGIETYQLGNTYTGAIETQPLAFYIHNIPLSRIIIQKLLSLLLQK